MSKNILITGATGNLGSAVAKFFVEAGHQVIGTLSPGRKAPESEVDFYECDLQDAHATQQLFSTLKKKYKTLDAAILLVGGFGMGSIENASSEDMLKMFNLNYLTAFNCSQNAYQWMKENEGGRMIMVGAKPAVEGGGSEVLPYAVSKSAVMKLAELLSESGKAHNIQASVIIPSIIDTRVNRESMPDANFADWVTPEEIAESIGFLVSEKASPLRDAVFKLYKNA